MKSIIKCVSCGKKPRTCSNKDRGKWVVDKKADSLKTYQSVRCGASGCHNRTWTRGYCSEHLKEMNNESMRKIFIESLRPSNNNPDVHDETTPPPRRSRSAAGCVRKGFGRNSFSGKADEKAREDTKGIDTLNLPRRRSFQLEATRGDTSFKWEDLHPPPISEERESVYDRLTSVKTFTGTHKHRFDEEGHGLGLKGRDSIPKGKGFLPDKYRMYDVI